jgi:hypothetical protein
MYELTLKSRKQLERATLRAQAEKLHIEEVSFGIYKVNGSTGNLYLVGIEPAKSGEGYDVCCSCPTQQLFLQACGQRDVTLPDAGKGNEPGPDLNGTGMGRCRASGRE